MTNALRRREEILRAVRELEIRSQEDLLHALRKRGHRVTQPTLSRDVRELGLIKTPNGYTLPADLAPATADPISFVPQQWRQGRLEQLVREFVLSVEQGGTLVVIRTPPADAQPVARAIDEAGLNDVLGTVGGDDTIFLALRTERAAAALVRRLSNLIATSHPRRTRA